MIKHIAAVTAIAALAAAPVWAHHSFAAEYDASKLLVLNGTVTRIDWANPHVFLHLDVKGAGGTTSNWNLEMASPNSMRRQGWLPNTVKAGDPVTVEAYAAKDYPTGAKAHRVKVLDGRWLFADSGGPSGPPPEVYSQR